ncbi:MAG: hypothetical protein RIC19_06910 [Phaeodactylibacter sp.]|uniref:tetratricopeptide repeat protein n=1 Tax=Phaeodactylibacter sp. TaxID=1940289 RepID=UPI0032EBD543
MKKREKPEGKKNLSKEDFVRFHRKGGTDVNIDEYDVFAQQALKGVRYQKEDPAVAFSRMEKKLGIAPPEAKQLNFRKGLAIAAGFLILVSVSYIALFQKGGISGEALFDTHFAPISYIDNDLQRGTRTQGPPSNNIKEKAIQAYTAEDYSAAEGLFQLYLNESASEDRIARFFYGITLLEQDKLKPAISIFQDARNNPPIPALQRPATYYLALAYVRQNQHDQAMPLLQSLTGKQDRYGRTAQEMLTAYGL